MVKARMGFVLWAAACGPTTPTSVGSDHGGSTSASADASGDDGSDGESSSTGCADGEWNEADVAWCPFTPTEAAALPRERERVFGSEVGDIGRAMAWDGARVLFSFALDGDETEIRGSTTGDAAFDTSWILTDDRSPMAIVATDAGTFVIHAADVADSNPAIARLLPDGGVQAFAEFDAPIVNERLVADDAWVYALLGAGGGPSPQSSAIRVPVAGGSPETVALDLVAVASTGGRLVGIRNTSETHCDCYHCYPVTVTHDVLALDPASAIVEGLCASGDPDGRLPMSYRMIGVVEDGFVVEDGPLLHVGFDGTRRLIAAPPGEIEDAIVSGGLIWFISDLSSNAERIHSLNRVAITGGPIEELARSTDPYRSIRLGAITPTHAYVWDHDTRDEAQDEIWRVAL